MKRIWPLPAIAAALAMVFATACSISGTNKGVPPKPNSELAEKAGISLDEMGEGYWVFNRKCLECHAAQIPSDSLIGQWHPVVEELSGNVGLSMSEEQAVLNYARAANLR